MRRYLLTEKERKLLLEYLETSKKSAELRVLRSRCKKLDFDAISSDLELIRRFLAKKE